MNQEFSEIQEHTMIKKASKWCEFNCVNDLLNSPNLEYQRQMHYTRKIGKSKYIAASNRTIKVIFLVMSISADNTHISFKINLYGCILYKIND